MRGVFLHLLADALGSVIVIISALVIEYSPWQGRFYVDPALSCLMVVLILNSVWPLCKKTVFLIVKLLSLPKKRERASILITICIS